MRVQSVKTPKINPGTHKLLDVLDDCLPALGEGSIVAITSKIVAICEGSVVRLEDADKDELIRSQAQLYAPREASRHSLSFTITKNLLIPTAGIDESNVDGYYVLWPRDSQATANKVRAHLAAKHNLQRVGVIITDSTSRPLQRGTSGIGISGSGFEMLRNYVGQPDIYGRKMKVTHANILNGLAAAAVVAMGEGDEQTPVAVIDDVSFVKFQPRNPTAEELAELRIEPEDDLYWPLLKNAPWQKGGAQ